MKSIINQATTKVIIPLLILVLAFVFCAGTVAAASEDNNNQSSNSTTLQTANSELNGTQNNEPDNTGNNEPALLADPQIWRDGVPVARGIHPAGYQYSTIAEAINDALDGDTIMLESGGIFHEQLTVGKSLTFNVLDNGPATLNGSTFSGYILTINSGVTVYLYNLIFADGNTSGSGGAIFNSGTLTAENCTFINNTSSANGGAICNWQCTFALTNCTFVGNHGHLGGAILSYRSSNPISITGCTFTDNTATEGAAINNNADSTITIADSNFTGNHADLGGAIINFSNLSITGSNLENNIATYGGAFCIGSTDVTTTAHFNRIVGNTAPNGNSIYCSGSTVDATNNWWGNNTPDFNSLFKVSNGGTVYADPWMILRVTTNPGTINNSETSQVTVDLLHDSTYDPANPDASYHNPSLGHVPDGLPILLNLSWGSFTNPLITHLITTYTVNDTVTATFYANEGKVPTDPVTVNARLDNSSASGTINVNPVSNLLVNLNGPGTVSAGKQITYTITVTNSGLDDAENVLLTDSLPPGLSNVRWTAVYSGGASGPASGTGNLNINLGTLPAGGSCVITVNGTIPASTPADTTLSNTVTITTSTQLIDPSSTTDTVTTTVKRESDLELGKTVNNPRPDVGDTVTYTVTAHNNGPSDATNIQVQDIMPSDFTDVSITPSQGTYDEETGIWTVNLTSGESATLTLAGKVSNLMAGKKITNTATILGTTNATNATIYVPKADIYIQITSNKNNPQAGEKFTLTYKLGNNGPDDAQNVTITIPLPEGFVISEIKGDGNWIINGNTLTWTFNNVTVGDPYLYITGWTNQPGIYMFSASIASETFSINSMGVSSLRLNEVPQANAATITNTATQTVGMQKTGMPMAAIALAILMVLGGFIGSQKRK